MDRRHKVVEEKSGFIHPSIHNYTMTDHHFILMNVHFNHVDLQGQTSWFLYSFMYANLYCMQFQNSILYLESCT